MAPSLVACETYPDTPSDPDCAVNRVPDSTGNTEVIPHGVCRPARAQYASHRSACVLDSQVVSCAVVPEPSERTTGTIDRAGSASAGLSALMAASLHLVMTPVKILASTSPDSRRLV